MARRRCNGGITGKQCHRWAWWEVWYLGRWHAVCRYHKGSFVDLPRRPVDEVRPCLQAGCLFRMGHEGPHDWATPAYRRPWQQEVRDA